MSDKEDEFYDCVSTLEDAKIEVEPLKPEEETIKCVQQNKDIVNPDMSEEAHTTDITSSDVSEELVDKLTTLSKIIPENVHNIPENDVSDKNMSGDTNLVVNGESEKHDKDNETKEVLSNDDSQATNEIVEELNDSEIEKMDEENLTDEEKFSRRKEAKELKSDGNTKFREEAYDEAIEIYTHAIKLCPKCYANDLSVLYSNRSICYMKSDKNEIAIKDCSSAIEFNEAYIKPLLRRAQLYEKLEKFDEALEDYKNLVEKKPSMSEYHVACRRLTEKINERNEKLKTEMMGKLKDLGNLVLKPFGLSTTNFQLEQNTDSGSYNIKFVNNPGPSTTSNPNNQPNNNTTDNT